MLACCNFYYFMIYLVCRKSKIKERRRQRLMAILKSDSGDIVYTLTRRKGMKNILIKVQHDGSVCVSASPAVSDSRIEEFIRAKASWIVSTAAAKKPSFSAGDKLANGMKLRIFGEILTLQIRFGWDEDAVSDGENLIVTVRELDNQSHIRQLLIGFIAQRGRTVLGKYYDCFYERCGYMGNKPMLVLKALKSKWGHCDYKNNQIMLNFALCGLPTELAAYVAAHEVAHLLVHNHSAEFYKVGESLYPGFRHYNRLLKDYDTRLWEYIVQ